MLNVIINNFLEPDLQSSHHALHDIIVN